MPSPEGTIEHGARPWLRRCPRCKRWADVRRLAIVVTETIVSTSCGFGSIQVLARGWGCPLCGLRVMVQNPAVAGGGDE